MNTKRKALQMLVALLFVTGSLLLTASTTTAAPQSWRWQGVMTMTIEIPNIYLSATRVERYTTNVEILVAAPQQVGAHKEQNPFNLVIQSTPLINNPGEASIWSSLPAEGIIFQYWTLTSQRDRNGNITVTGQLTNNHVQEALALNLITVPTEIAPNLTMPYTHAMANGTHMQGTFHQNGQARLVIQGNTTDTFHPFTLEIVARFVN